MKATKEDIEQRDKEYADQFNEPDQEKRQISDDEAFGLTEPAAEAPAAEEAAPAEGSPAEEVAEAPAVEAGESAEGTGDAPHGEQPTGEAAPSPADIEQRLKSWEGRLKARQAELDAREAAMSNSGVNEEQSSGPAGDGYEATQDAPGEGEGESDPAAVLADDFGQDFVNQITALVRKVAHECMGGVDARVDQVIAALQNERLQNHFNSIAQAHADFMDVVESPDFSAWKDAQPDRDRLQQVIDGGSARQIIDMLSAFKNATKKADNPDYDGDAQFDAAEGVRSSGLSLPKEPVADDDFARAWNEA
jgi:hypothetical protein